MEGLMSGGLRGQTLRPQADGPTTAETELVALGGRIEIVTSRAIQITQVLNDTAERVLGPSPSKEKEANGAAPVIGTLGRLHERIATLDRVLDHAEAQARKLSQL